MACTVPPITPTFSASHLKPNFRLLPPPPVPQNSSGIVSCISAFFFLSLWISVGFLFYTIFCINYVRTVFLCGRPCLPATTEDKMVAVLGSRRITYHEERLLCSWWCIFWKMTRRWGGSCQLSWHFMSICWIASLVYKFIDWLLWAQIDVNKLPSQ